MKIFAAQGARLDKTDFPELTPSHPNSNRIRLRRCVPLGAMLLLAGGLLSPAALSVFGNATATEPNRLAAPLQAGQVVRAGVEDVASVPDNALESTGGEAVVIGPGHTVAAYH